MCARVCLYIYAVYVYESIVLLLCTIYKTKQYYVVIVAVAFCLTLTHSGATEEKTFTLFICLDLSALLFTAPPPPVPRLVAKRLDLMYMLCYVCVCHSRATVEYCNLLSLISNALPFRYTIRWLRLYSNTQLGPPHLHFPRVSISEGPISSTSATHKTIQPRKPTLCA